MKAIIIYKDGEIEKREGFKQLNTFKDKIYLSYKNKEEFCVLEIPKSVVEDVIIKWF